MGNDARSTSKLAHGLRYGAVAVIATWSLLALAAYALVDALSGWATVLAPADGWFAWGGGLLGQAGGLAIGVLWAIGSLFILGAMAVIRRFAA